MKKPFLFFILVAIFVFFGGRLYYRITDDFRLGNIAPPHSMQGMWKDPLMMDASFQDAFNHEWIYLGKGAQAYAFLSYDKKYVIKFFKFKHLRPNFFIENLPDISALKEYKSAVRERKARKLLSVFSGYELAYSKDKDHAGLLYLHLQQTAFNLPKAHLIDKAGRKWTVDLDEAVFLVQTKGESLESSLKESLSKNNIQEASEKVLSILAMLVDEFGRGLVDFDHGILYNTGFSNGVAFHLDVGQLHEDKRVCKIGVYRHELKKAIWFINEWVEAHFPSAAETIKVSMISYYESVVQEPLLFESIDPQTFKENRRRLIVE